MCMPTQSFQQLTMSGCSFSAEERGGMSTKNLPEMEGLDMDQTQAGLLRQILENQEAIQGLSGRLMLLLVSIQFQSATMPVVGWVWWTFLPNPLWDHSLLGGSSLSLQCPMKTPGNCKFGAPGHGSSPGPSGFDEDSITPFILDSERGDRLSSWDSAVKGVMMRRRVPHQLNASKWTNIWLFTLNIPQKSPLSMKSRSGW